MVYTDDLKGRDLFDMQIEYKSSLAIFFEQYDNR